MWKESETLMAFILLVREWTRDGSAKWVPVDSGTKKSLKLKEEWWQSLGDETKIEKLEE